jgi:hypothetical protein
LQLRWGWKKKKSLGAIATEYSEEIRAWTKQKTKEEKTKYTSVLSPSLSRVKQINAVQLVELSSILYELATPR